MRRKRGETDSFSVSFLDVAACGFGAMIILLMITKSGEPDSIESVDVPAEGAIIELQEKLFAVRGETTIFNRDLNAKHEQLSAMKDRIARLQRDLNDTKGRFQTSNQLSDEIIDEVGKLDLAQQTMTEEMQRLLANSPEPESSPILGIPIDSEYFIFVIDTSGSMVNNAWEMVLSFIDDTLNVYPQVKGIQIMNDMGNYMFNSLRGEWIEDSPSRRATIISTLRNWHPYSNSSPVEGVTQAIRTFYEEGKKISIYVLGDDFQGGSIQDVLDTIDRINKEDDNGDRLVRIHGIAFPVLFANAERYRQTVYKFSSLMREMADRNGGTFVGLNDFRVRY